MQSHQSTACLNDFIHSNHTDQKVGSVFNIFYSSCLAFIFACLNKTPFPLETLWKFSKSIFPFLNLFLIFYNYGKNTKCELDPLKNILSAQYSMLALGIMEYSRSPEFIRFVEMRLYTCWREVPHFSLLLVPSNHILLSASKHFIRDDMLAAKSLQTCPTLCNPIDSSPPGTPVPGILQARTLKWAAISFSIAWKWKVKVKSLSRVRLLATPWTAAYQAFLSMGFSRQSTGVGCHCLLRIYTLLYIK